MNRTYIISGILFPILLVLLFFIGMQQGSFDTSFETLLQALFSYNPDSAEHFVLIELRLPRLLLAFFVGGALALSGYLMQVMVNNPLADPYLLGTSSGAGLGISIFFSGFVSYTLAAVSVVAFIGALLVTLLATLIAYKQNRIDPSRLLLAGLALSALMVSLTSLVMYLAEDPNVFKNVIFWTMGGFDHARWSHIPIIAAAVALLTFLFVFLQKHITVLLLGETQAQSLGVKVKQLRWILLLASSMATGIAVAAAGPIGFVGLIIPHFVRGAYGVTERYGVLFSVLWGGLFVLTCDVVARYFFRPTGVPIGIITSFVGIPFFIYLLGKNRFKN